MFHKRKSLWLFLLPGTILLFSFYLIPFLGGLKYSVVSGDYKQQFVGLNNYQKLWQNKMFLLGMKNTLELSSICAPLLWILSFLLASILNRIKPFGGFFRSCTLLPYLAPSSAILMIWLIVFDYGGPINRLLEAVGIHRFMWLSSEYLRIPIVMMFLWKNIGFCTIVFLAALQSVPLPLYEYSMIEGASFLVKAFKITLPLVTPSAFLVFVFAWINAFKIFKEVYFIAGPYPDFSVYTLQNYLSNMFQKLDYQMVTAAAYSFGTIAILLFLGLFMLQRRASQAISGGA